eukprot:TRINITY_DN3726_c0_g1_i4.p2 TRINITY_DN3726_c0_g1~~TRINITY_DN3726_c0_g1_i4.p2  ORF type:complete len:595 (-),score=219.64 TRINITY_DN3726_c0_g1_i4:2187-3971(-)
MVNLHTDSPCASQVTFNRDISCRSVTLQGDLYDPAGTLTGGSRPQGENVLLNLHELNALQAELRRLQQNLQQTLDGIEVLQEAGRRCQKLKSAYEIKQHEAELAKRTLATSKHSLIVKDFEQKELQLAETESHVETATTKVEAAKAKCAQLKATQTSDPEFKRLEAEIAKVKVQNSAESKLVKDLKHTAEKLRLEKEAMETELRAVEGQVETLKGTLATRRKEVEDAEAAATTAKEEYNKANEEVEQKRKELQLQLEALGSLNRKHDKLVSQCHSDELQIKKVEHLLQNLEKEREQLQKSVKEKEASHSWIKADKHLFGKAGTEYHFGDAKVMAEVKQRYAQLLADQEKLSKTVNRKVLAMYESTEDKCKDLVEKREIIEKDKQQIQATITKLDRNKNEALKTTYEQVNKDFGSIFSTLLPGTKAKLEPVEGTTIFDGLEVKVAFGGVWKQSLTELSGGQRSLLALSIILALLRFKPAPMYILDEIDAALDPSHTQNIGQILRTHFSKSQFIVVSLKKGMYQNANVLFKTKCVDGISTVSRHTGEGIGNLVGGADAAAPQMPPKPRREKKERENEEGQEDGKKDPPSKKRRVGK